MAYQPIATEIGAIYKLTAPSGAVAVFNDPADPNYVGMLTEITGLDSAEVRENATDLVEADGGAHGPFYFGRRPITFTVRVFGHATNAEREARVDRARRAALAMQADAILSWKPSDWASRAYIELFTPVRRQQPFRESGAWVKDLQIALVSEFAYIFSTQSKTVATGVATENRGNVPAYPLVRFTGASANPTITDGTRTFRTTGLNLAAGEQVEFDMLNHTGKFIAGARNGQSANRYIDFTTTQWPYVSGNGTSQTFAMTGGGTASIVYRDTWA